MATRQGLQAKSFDLAADSYRDAVGGGISGDSVRRITQGWGAQVEEQRAAEAEKAGAPAQRGESPPVRRLPISQPVGERGNLSTDGMMLLIRGEGWKEVKLTCVSTVTVKAATQREVREGGGSRREQDPLVKLSEHSYQAGLWDADTMGERQYAEGLRRGLDQCPRLSSVNDGALWIERITQTNFAEAVQIVDWPHAEERLWAVGNAVWGEGSDRARAWVAPLLDQLWVGQGEAVLKALQGLDLTAEPYPDEVRQAPGYFEHNLPRMRYDEYRAQGYPLGSGTVESAASTVVHHRLKRPGRGWGRASGQAMLAGLSELNSARFDDVWQATLPESA